MLRNILWSVFFKTKWIQLKHSIFFKQNFLKIKISHTWGSFWLGRALDTKNRNKNVDSKTCNENVDSKTRNKNVDSKIPNENVDAKTHNENVDTQKPQCERSISQNRNKNVIIESKIATRT